MARGRRARSDETADAFLKRVLLTFEQRERRADEEMRSFVPTPPEEDWLRLSDVISKMVSANDVPLHLVIELESDEARWQWAQLGDFAICLITGVALNHALPYWADLRVLAVADAIAASASVEAPSMMGIATRLRESTFAPLAQGRTYRGVEVVLDEAMAYLRTPGGRRIEIALAYDAMQHAAQRIAHPITPLTKLFMSARDAGIQVGDILRAMGPPTAFDVLQRVGRA